MEDTKYWKNRPINDNRKDWRNGSKDWVEEYVDSKYHPHRQLIAYTIGSVLPKDYQDTTILEIGCNAGPNISLLRDEFPHLKDHNLYGIDINEDSIKRAKEWLPAVNWKVGSVFELPYEDKSMDVVLLDAVLMYVDDKEIGKAMKEIDRVCKRALIICDWNSTSKQGKVIDGHWARWYDELMRDYGFKVNHITLTKETWPNERWGKNGRIWYAVRQ